MLMFGAIASLFIPDEAQANGLHSDPSAFMFEIRYAERSHTPSNAHVSILIHDISRRLTIMSWSVAEPVLGALKFLARL